MTPYLIVGLASAGAAAGLYWFGYQAGKDACVAEQARTQATITQVETNVQKGIADELAKIKPNTQVINQRVREVVRVEPVYRGCVHAPGVLGDINRALTGAEPAGGGSVPPADPPR